MNGVAYGCQALVLQYMASFKRQCPTPSFIVLSAMAGQNAKTTALYLYWLLAWSMTKEVQVAPLAVSVTRRLKQELPL